VALTRCPSVVIFIHLQHRPTRLIALQYGRSAFISVSRLVDIPVNAFSRGLPIILLFDLNLESFGHDPGRYAQSSSLRCSCSLTDHPPSRCTCRYAWHPPCARCTYHLQLLGGLGRYPPACFPLLLQVCLLSLIWVSISHRLVSSCESQPVSVLHGASSQHFRYGECLR